jgi:hypothetical protein
LVEDLVGDLAALGVPADCFDGERRQQVHRIMHVDLLGSARPRDVRSVAGVIYR